METNAQELLRILRRLPSDRFQKEAIRIVESGESLPADLARRLGIKGSEVTV